MWGSESGGRSDEERAVSMKSLNPCQFALLKLIKVLLGALTNLISEDRQMWMGRWSELKAVIVVQVVAQVQMGPGFVSMPALIRRSLMVAAESLPSLVRLTKNPC